MYLEKLKQLNRELKRRGLRLPREIRVSPRVIIKNGDTVISAKNKILPAGLITLANLWSGVPLSHDASQIALNSVKLFNEGIVTAMGTVGDLITIGIGSDTTTPTDATMTDLVSPISWSPNEVTVYASKTSDTWYNAYWKAVWLAGTVSGTIGEVGVRCRAQETLGSEHLSANVLFSRLSVADGDFSSWVIDTSKNLLVYYTWRFKW